MRCHRLPSSYYNSYVLHQHSYLELCALSLRFSAIALLSIIFGSRNGDLIADESKTWAGADGEVHTLVRYGRVFRYVAQQRAAARHMVLETLNSPCGRLDGFAELLRPTEMDRSEDVEEGDLRVYEDVELCWLIWVVDEAADDDGGRSGPFGLRGWWCPLDDMSDGEVKVAVVSDQGRTADCRRVASDRRWRCRA